MTTSSLVHSLVDAHRRLDVAAQVMDVLEHTPDSMVSRAERAVCERVVAEARETYDELVDSLGAEERWQFVLQLMLVGALDADQ